MRLETGLGYPHVIEYEKDQDGNNVDKYAFCFLLKEMVMEGRKLNGEPETWDF
jgi:hypothetical protein